MTLVRPKPKFCKMMESKQVGDIAIEKTGWDGTFTTYQHSIQDLVLLKPNLVTSRVVSIDLVLGAAVCSILVGFCVEDWLFTITRSTINYS